MAVSEQHRSSIHRSLAPVIGQQEVEALLSQFPSRYIDEPASKEFVRAEVAGLRAEIAGLDARISDRLRNQTCWMAGAMAVGMGLAAGIARFGG